MATENTTFMGNLVDPEVLANIVSYQLEKKIKFAPLAVVDTTLQGQAGTTVTMPAFGYIGDAKDVAEGEVIPLDRLSTTSKQVEIKKAAKGAGLTDEAILSGYGDPQGEIASQLAQSIANKIDNDIIAAANESIQSAGAVNSVDSLQTALDQFSDEEDEAIVAILSPKDAAALRNDAGHNWTIGSEAGASVIFNGTYGEILGVTIVRSKKVADGGGFLIKTGNDNPAFKLFLKRGIDIEPDRHPETKTTEWYAAEHYVAYLNNPSRVVKLGSGAAVEEVPSGDLPDGFDSQTPQEAKAPQTPNRKDEDKN